MSRLHRLVPLILLAGCAGSSESTGTTGSALTGPIDLRVAEDTDADADDTLPAPARQATSIVVTFSRIDVRTDLTGTSMDAGDAMTSLADDDVWRTLSLGPRTVDLLALPTGGFASLGITELPAGGIERMRVFVSSAGPNDVVTKDGEVHPLVVPSGEIDVAGDFDAEGCASGFVTLAFAGRRSIEVHPVRDGVSADAGATDGGSDAGPVEWILRPVIRLREAVMKGAPCMNADEGDREHGHGPLVHDR